MAKEQESSHPRNDMIKLLNSIFGFTLQNYTHMISSTIGEITYSL